jgi:hypothetical protein
MATSSLAISRRYRRRRQIAILLTLAVVVTVVALAVTYRTEQRETTEYLALVGDVANSELAVSESLQDLFASLNELDRPDILGRIEGLREQTTAIDAQMQEVVVTREVADLHGYFAVALDSWHQAIAGLEAAVTEVMDQPLVEGDTEQVAPTLLIEAFDRLRIGDVAYASFLEAVAELDPEIEAPTYPEVVYLPENLDVAAVANQLRLSRDLDERRDVRVSANTTPEPQGDVNDVLAMPFQDQLAVTAVVTNSGNVLQEEITVTLELSQDGDSGSPFEEGRIIAALEPLSSESLEFVGLDLEPGVLYTLTVTADIADDANPDNNVWQVIFATNDQ